MQQQQQQQQLKQKEAAAEEEVVVAAAEKQQALNAEAAVAAAQAEAKQRQQQQLKQQQQKQQKQAAKLKVEAALKAAHKLQVVVRVFMLMMNLFRIGPVPLSWALSHSQPKPIVWVFAGTRVSSSSSSRASTNGHFCSTTTPWTHCEREYPPAPCCFVC